MGGVASGSLTSTRALAPLPQRLAAPRRESGETKTWSGRRPEGRSSASAPPGSLPRPAPVRAAPSTRRRSRGAARPPVAETSSRVRRSPSPAAASSRALRLACRMRRRASTTITPQASSSTRTSVAARWS